ncbi:hypothetical protein Btru_058614, partial [Bulinus truncatus]
MKQGVPNTSGAANLDMKQGVPNTSGVANLDMKQGVPNTSGAANLDMKQGVPNTSGAANLDMKQGVPNISGVANLDMKQGVLNTSGAANLDMKQGVPNTSGAANLDMKQGVPNSSGTAYHDIKSKTKLRCLETNTTVKENGDKRKKTNPRCCRLPTVPGRSFAIFALIVSPPSYIKSRDTLRTFSHAVMEIVRRNKLARNKMVGKLKRKLLIKNISDEKNQ